MSKSIDNDDLVPYKGQAIQVVQTPGFQMWHQNLRDRQAKFRIAARIDRIGLGNFGDTKSVGDGVQELRMRFGPGYRIYYIWQGEVLVILLNGGDKGSQARDIANAKRLAKELNDGSGTPSI